MCGLGNDLDESTAGCLFKVISLILKYKKIIVEQYIEVEHEIF